MTTVHAKLVTSERDLCGYTTYVFKNLESWPKFGHEYIMTTRVPNWQHKDLEINEVGFLTYQDVIAGEDTWYDPESGQKIPYKYTNTYFIKFVKEVDNCSKKDIIL